VSAAVVVASAPRGSRQTLPARGRLSRRPIARLRNRRWRLVSVGRSSGGVGPRSEQSAGHKLSAPSLKGWRKHQRHRTQRSAHASPQLWRRSPSSESQNCRTLQDSASQPITTATPTVARMNASGGAFDTIAITPPTPTRALPTTCPANLRRSRFVIGPAANVSARAGREPPVTVVATSNTPPRPISHRLAAPQSTPRSLASEADGPFLLLDDMAHRGRTTGPLTKR